MYKGFIALLNNSSYILFTKKALFKPHLTLLSFLWSINLNKQFNKKEVSVSFNFLSFLVFLVVMEFCQVSLLLLQLVVLVPKQLFLLFS